MQKSIRRGLEKEALFFMSELAGSGYAGYVWRRYHVIASEDIGLANNSAISTITALHSSWSLLVKTNHEEAIIPLVHATLLLVRSAKSRLVDEAKMYCLKNGDMLEVPDWALDVHTRRGKAKGRGLKFFLENGMYLENEDKSIPDPVGHKSFFIKFLTDVSKKLCSNKGYDENKDPTYYKNSKDIPPLNRLC